MAAVGGTSVAAGWADPAPGTESIALSQQQPLAKAPALDADARASVARDFGELATRLGAWTGDSVPAVSSTFAKGRDLAAAQDVQTASVQSVQSVASIVSTQSVQSAQSVQSTQSTQSVQSTQSTQSVQSAQSTQSVQSAQLTQSVQSPSSPDSPASVDSPAGRRQLREHRHPGECGQPEQRRLP